MNSENKKNISLLKSRIYKMDCPYSGQIPEDWTPVRIFFGQSETVNALWCHLSVLKTGAWPHPPHKHEQEEIVFMLTGEAELIIPKAPDGRERRRVGPGDLSYYPANFSHTIRAASEQPANYLMLKWHNDLKHKGSRLAFSEFKVFDQMSADEGAGLKAKVMFKGQTDFLKSFNCHTSVLAPGAGYDPHSDDYDVLICVLAGEVETLGERVTPHSVIYYAAGEPHGMRNSGEVPAKYIVFEFHGWPKSALAAMFRPLRVFFSKITDPEKWKRKLSRLLAKEE